MSESIDEPECQRQHDRLVAALEKNGAEVILVPLVPGQKDSVFMKDSAVLLADKDKIGRAFLATPGESGRDTEQGHREQSLKQLGFDIAGRASHSFEGGDLAIGHDEHWAYLGYGFRTDAKAAAELSDFLNRKIMPLELTNKDLFHLDLAFAVLSNGLALGCKAVMTDEAWSQLFKIDSFKDLVEVTLDEAMDFGLNMVEVNGVVISGLHSPRLVRKIESSGLNFQETDLGHFHKREGSAAFLVSKIHSPSH